MLFHFCAAANAAGESWYKFAQLTDIVGRSKAAISGYLAELREVGVVETEQQRTANGYHAHLLVRLVGWSSFLAEWSAMADAARRRTSRVASRVPSPASSQRQRAPAEKLLPSPESHRTAFLSSSETEHRVQDIEHSYPTDNNNIKYTNTTSGPEIVNNGVIETPCESWSSDDELRWAYFKGGAPGFAFDREPPSDLLKRAIQHAEHMQRAVEWCEETEAQALVVGRLREFAREARIIVGDGIDAVAAAIAKRARAPGSIEKAIDALRENWAPHWRRLSTPEQVAALLDSEAVRGRLTCDRERAAHRARARASIARIELKRRREVEAPGDATIATSLAARMVAYDARRPDTVCEAAKNGSASGRKIGQIRHRVEIEVSR
ncbi:hypothetical protein [Rubrimonas cliftonensis]|uniref:hypothetical protein n=1 Tax=Rubrimonas cliftonensis TaxID=89524 RepID=UPI001114AB47|nr:hypothetical protein [Rubrimonas cliftonensis]